MTDRSEQLGAHHDHAHRRCLGPGRRAASTFDDLNPYTGRRPGDRRRRHPGGRPEGGRGGRGGIPGLGDRRRRRSVSGSSWHAATILERRRDEVVALLARETGCTFGFAMFQMGFVPGLFRQAAGLAYSPSGRSSRPTTRAPSRWASADRSGVVAAIAPWNAALILSARSIAAPLVAGNTVVLKPSPDVAVRGRAAVGRDLRGGRPAGTAS